MQFIPGGFGPAEEGAEATYRAPVPPTEVEAVGAENKATLFKCVARARSQGLPRTPWVARRHE